MSVAKLVGRPTRKGVASERHIKARVTEAEYQKVLDKAIKKDVCVAEYVRKRLGL